MNLYNKLSCNSRGIHTVFNWLIHWFESACMMVLYKRQQHKASQTTSHTFYYTYSTPKWNSMHPTAITVLVHARYMQICTKTKGWKIQDKTIRLQQKICVCMWNITGRKNVIGSSRGEGGNLWRQLQAQYRFTRSVTTIRVQRGHRTHSVIPPQSLSSTAGGAGSRRYNFVLCCLSRPEFGIEI